MTAARMSALLVPAALCAYLAGAGAAQAQQRPERSGKEVVAARCSTCHESGAGGAPRIGDKAAWIPRLKSGFDNLVHAAIRGHGGMPARGGLAELTDTEIRNAVAYMIGDPGAAAKK